MKLEKLMKCKFFPIFITILLVPMSPLHAVLIWSDDESGGKGIIVSFSGNSYREDAIDVSNEELPDKISENIGSSTLKSIIFYDVDGKNIDHVTNSLRNIGEKIRQSNTKNVKAVDSSGSKAIQEVLNQHIKNVMNEIWN